MTLIERVARAGFLQAEKNGRLGGYTGPPMKWETESENLRDDWRAVARAAIEAMRPWGRELQARGEDWEGDVNFAGFLDNYSFGGVWEAGIDEALKEKP